MNLGNSSKMLLTVRYRESKMKNIEQKRQERCIEKPTYLMLNRSCRSREWKSGSRLHLKNW